MASTSCAPITRLDVMTGKHGPVDERLHAKLTPVPPPNPVDRLGCPLTEPCQLWGNAIRKDGYAMINMGDGRRRLIHRVAYALATGQDVDAFGELDHRCRVRHCAEVTHLEEATHAENVRRGDVGAINRAKKHCPQGHRYTEANTYVNPVGSRVCRQCTRTAGRAYESRHPERRHRPH